MIPFNKGIFKAPKYSSFDLSHDNKLTFAIGDLIPAYWSIMYPGDRFRTDVGFLSRFAPMLAPVMQRFDLTIDWHFVPMRLILGEKFSERFFNLHNPDSPESLRTMIPHDYSRVLMNKNLLDYLGYPQFDELQEEFRNSLLNDSYDSRFSVSETESYNASVLFNPFDTIPAFQNVFGLVLRGNPQFVSAGVASPSYALPGSIKTLPLFIASEIGLPSSISQFIFSFDDLLKHTDVSISEWTRRYIQYIWDLLIESLSSNYEPFQAFEENWPRFVKFACLSIHETPAEGTPTFNDLPLKAYWRIVFDWYVDNTLFYTESGNIYGEYLEGPTPLPQTADFGVLPIPSWDNSTVYSFDLLKPYKRNFAKDYFTSCFVSPQAGSDVKIPVNGSIADLRQANWLQKLKERLAWIGPRYKDVNKGIFNIDSSDARLDRTEVLSRGNHQLDIQTVVQTNQAQVNEALQTPIGSLSGMSNTRGGSFGCDYLAEEHGIIMCLVSVRPKTSYLNAVRKDLFKSSPYTFLWPQFAQLGEQEVLNKELYCDFDKYNSLSSSESYKGQLEGVFGFQRRYGEYMFSFSELHGLFRSSMDNWHASRRFNTTPTLSQSFLEINPVVSDLNRIFAVEDDDNPVYLYMYFDITSVRPLPRYINYDL